jgi:hypothetical protein
LWKFWVTWASTVRSVTYSRAAMARLDMPSAISPRTSSFPLAEAGQRVLPAAPHQARDDRGVDHRLPVHDAAQGVHHDGDAEYVLLGE